MKIGGYFGADKILYFNGGLFDDDSVLPLDGADMDIIAGIDALDWGAIKPSIFGTLFERGLDPNKRSLLGALHRRERHSGCRACADGASQMRMERVTGGMFGVEE
jgi:hypothetical protein